MRTVSFSTCFTMRFFTENIESRRIRIPAYSCNGELPFDREELEGETSGSETFDCPFNRAFRSSFYTAYYNLYVRVGGEEIRRQEVEDFNVLMMRFRDSNRAILSGVDKKSLHIKVGKLGEILEKHFPRFADLNLDRCQVYEAFDPIEKLSLERLQELEKQFLETYYPKLGLERPGD